MNFALLEDFGNIEKIFFFIFYKSIYFVFIFMKLSIWIEAMDAAGQISGYNLAAGYRISSYFS